MAAIEVGLSQSALNAAALTNSIRRDDCGALVVFEGTVRSPSHGHEVLRLEYEAYEGVAEKQLQSIAEEVAAAHDLLAALAIHRTGNVAVGEPAVVVAVVAPHRDAAFDGCRQLIDRIKSEVAIWKKEVLPDGSHWVEGH